MLAAIAAVLSEYLQWRLVDSIVSLYSRLALASVMRCNKSDPQAVVIYILIAASVFGVKSPL